MNGLPRRVQTPDLTQAPAIIDSNPTIAHSNARISQGQPEDRLIGDEFGATDSGSLERTRTISKRLDRAKTWHAHTRPSLRRK
jgi:hypothetical protein